MEKSEYKGFKDLKVYKLTYNLAIEIFKVTKTFPKEEKYSLVDQIRRSSRSVPSNVAEAWYRRRYPKAFVSKLVESAGEVGETDVWLDFSYDHGYIEKDKHEYFTSKYNEVARMLSSMINQPNKFCH